MAKPSPTDCCFSASAARAARLVDDLVCILTAKVSTDRCFSASAARAARLVDDLVCILTTKVSTTQETTSDPRW